MWKVLIVVVTGCLAVAAASVLRLKSNGMIPYKDCGSKHGEMTSLDISSCTGAEVCKLRRGTNVNVTVTFMSKELITNATTKVYGVIAGVPVPFPLTDPKVCDTVHVKCPVNKGSKVTYSKEINVKKIYPKIKLLVRWEVVDKAGEDVICFEVPAEITD